MADGTMAGGAMAEGSTAGGAMAGGAGRASRAGTELSGRSVKVFHGLKVKVGAGHGIGKCEQQFGQRRVLYAFCGAGLN